MGTRGTRIYASQKTRREFTCRTVTCSDGDDERPYSTRAGYFYVLIATRNSEEAYSRHCLRETTN